MKRQETAFVVCLLIAAGLGLFFYRAFVLDFPLLPNRTVQSWHVEAKLRFNGTKDPARVRLYLPRASEGYTIADENFVSGGFGMTTAYTVDTRNRVSTWTKRQTRGQEIIYYRAILYRTHPAGDQEPAKAAALPAPDIPVHGSAAFNDLAAENAEYFALGAIIDEIRQRSADTASFTAALLLFLQEEKNDGRLTTIKEHVPDLTGSAALAVHILQYAGIPARLMHGIALSEEGRDIPVKSWPEIFRDGAWKIYNLQTEKFETPRDRLGWWTGPHSLYTLGGGSKAQLSVSVRKHVENALTEAVWRGAPVREMLYKISVFSLPVDVQIVFTVLLLVPLGALVVAALRQLVGVQTFGTFMPVLVALAFRETQLLMGIALFSAIVCLGLVLRAYLNRLQLLLIPRLGLILTAVVVLIYLISLAMFHAGIHVGLSATLFPMVIMTMVIERMSVTLEESGTKAALQAAFGSLVTAVIGYGCMINSVAAHLIVTYPELLLIIAAAHIMLGRYNGYKLTEYYRFRMLDGKHGG